MVTSVQVEKLFNNDGNLSRAQRKQLADFSKSMFGLATAIATVGGGTTGLLDADASFITVTSAAATSQISLPAATLGKRLKVYVGANGCELISAVASHKVNGVVVGATNEAAIPANTLLDLEYVATDLWLMRAFTALGAELTAIIPDGL